MYWQHENIIKQKTHDAMLKRIESDPRYAIVYVDYLNKLMANYYPEQRILGQSPYPIVFSEVVAFADMHAWLFQRKLLMAQVFVGEGPRADIHRDENNEILARLPYPFDAEFYGNKGDSDGTLEWYEPIEIGSVSHMETVQPYAAPLEVGYTDFSTTRRHLLETGFVARWPYNEEWITILHYTG